jgi:thiamine-phosphate pyrophosphorylase
LPTRRPHGLYAVTPDCEDTRQLLKHVLAALEGGVRFVQYRNKSAAAALRREQASALKSLCEDYGASLIVNDHASLAAEVDAAGVHLGGEDGDIAEARATLGADKVIGISCYDRIERARTAVAAGADYIAFGSFFPSQVKPGAVRASLELLRQARRELAVPIAAIGGITLQNAPELVRAGADSVAVISALFGARDIGAAARGFSALFEAPDRS